MQGIKKLNNNFALCCDSNGTEIIAYGKGIGFGKFPCEIPLEKVDATYYNVKPQLMSMIETVQDDVFRVSEEVVRYAQTVSAKPVPSNFVFSLSDHIQFAIDRQRKGIKVKIPFVYEIEHLYETEFAIGKFALRRIGEELKVWLPQDEITGIALHFINNYQGYESEDETTDFEVMLDSLLAIIERKMQINIKRDSYDCYRFGAHMKYFVKRAGENALYRDGTGNELYYHMEHEYPAIYECMKEILGYLQPLLGIECSEEEQLYLMIHINRLCTNEDCNQ